MQVDKYDQERRNCEAENANAIAEQDRIDREYGDLMKRLNELKEIKVKLEIKQKDTEA